MREGDGGWGMGAGLAQQCSRLIRDVCGRRVAGPVHDDEPKDEPVLRLNPLRTRLTFTSGGRGVRGAGGRPCGGAGRWVDTTSAGLSAASLPYMQSFS